MAEEFDVPLLGQMPLNIDIRTHMDEGTPDQVWKPGDPLNNTAALVALRTAQNLAKLPVKFSLTDSLKLHKI